ncbi:mucin-19-like isoform X2 [Amphibalanus amphitrite]|uniref:mucin-19-like isoform X2 n=1 Tax=Amphibalanus amphitrite TaxID=1232801 RepID=UPI001C9283C5|nr:mucin-19-like isoform X2 [Amphibalanus amphitrite]
MVVQDSDNIAGRRRRLRKRRPSRSASQGSTAGSCGGILASLSALAGYKALPDGTSSQQEARPPPSMGFDAGSMSAPASTGRAKRRARKRRREEAETAATGIGRAKQLRETFKLWVPASGAQKTDTLSDPGQGREGNNSGGAEKTAGSGENTNTNGAKMDISIEVNNEKATNGRGKTNDNGGTESGAKLSRSARQRQRKRMKRELESQSGGALAGEEHSKTAPVTAPVTRGREDQQHDARAVASMSSNVEEEANAPDEKNAESSSVSGAARARLLLKRAKQREKRAEKRRERWRERAGQQQSDAEVKQNGATSGPKQNETLAKETEHSPNNTGAAVVQTAPSQAQESTSTRTTVKGNPADGSHATLSQQPPLSVSAARRARKRRRTRNDSAAESESVANSAQHEPQPADKGANRSPTPTNENGAGADGAARGGAGSRNRKKANRKRPRWTVLDSVTCEPETQENAEPKTAASMVSETVSGAETGAGAGGAAGGENSGASGSVWATSGAGGSVWATPGDDPSGSVRVTNAPGHGVTSGGDGSADATAGVGVSASSKRRNRKRKRRADLLTNAGLNATPTDAETATQTADQTGQLADQNPSVDHEKSAPYVNPAMTRAARRKMRQSLRQKAGRAAGTGEKPLTRSDAPLSHLASDDSDDDDEKSTDRRWWWKNSESGSGRSEGEEKPPSARAKRRQKRRRNKEKGTGRENAAASEPDAVSAAGEDGGPSPAKVAKVMTDTSPPIVSPTQPEASVEVDAQPQAEAGAGVTDPAAARKAKRAEKARWSRQKRRQALREKAKAEAAKVQEGSAEPGLKAAADSIPKQAVDSSGKSADGEKTVSAAAISAAAASLLTSIGSSTASKTTTKATTATTTAAIDRASTAVTSAGTIAKPVTNSITPATGTGESATAAAASAPPESSAGSGPKKPVSAPASAPTADPVADAPITATDAAVVTRRRPRRRRGQGVSQPGRLLLGGTINDPLNLAELEGMDDPSDDDSNNIPTHASKLAAKSASSASALESGSSKLKGAPSELAETDTKKVSDRKTHLSRTQADVEADKPVNGNVTAPVGAAKADAGSVDPENAAKVVEATEPATAAPSENDTVGTAGIKSDEHTKSTDDTNDTAANVACADSLTTTKSPFKKETAQTETTPPDTKSGDKFSSPSAANPGTNETSPADLLNTETDQKPSEDPSSAASAGKDAVATAAADANVAAAAATASADADADSDPEFDPRKAQFQYGNYNRYYGYRNGGRPDGRLACLKSEWFTGLDVLDVGCNIGHVTLTVARDYAPRRCVGLDIDSSLIKIARKNIKHYQEQRKTGKADPGDAQDAAKSAPAKPTNFPRNVSFVHANFVLESDALLETVKPEFDTVLCLSITKWIHLNFGDDGIRRFLRRVYLCLRPGGRLLLEPQPWSSYLKYKKLTPKISETFGQLQLRPDQFPELLEQLGFLPCQTVGRPRHSAAGFSRQLQLFIKPGGSHPSSDQDITAPSDTPAAPSDAPAAPLDAPAVPSDAPAAPSTNGVGSSAQPSAAAAPIAETTTDSAATDAANDTAAVATATTGVKGPAKEATHEAKTAAPVTEIAPPTAVEPAAVTAVADKPEEKVAETAAAASEAVVAPSTGAESATATATSKSSKAE